MKLNVKLLRKIQKHILEEPKRFMMGGVIVTAEPGKYYTDYGIDWRIPKCGTVACIGGWALLLSNVRTHDLCDAAELLGFDIEDGFSPDASKLFNVGGWPSKFAAKWMDAKTPRVRAKIAVARIDHLIATKGAE